VGDDDPEEFEGQGFEGCSLAGFWFRGDVLLGLLLYHKRKRGRATFSELEKREERGRTVSDLRPNPRSSLLPVLSPPSISDPTSIGEGFGEDSVSFVQRSSEVLNFQFQALVLGLKLVEESELGAACRRRCPESLPLK